MLEAFEGFSEFSDDVDGRGRRECGGGGFDQSTNVIR
jgi:hypothetical protein